MTTSTVRRLVALIVENFDVDEATMTPNTDLESLAFDSLVFVEMSLLFSREFYVEVGDDELTEAGTVAKIAELLDDRLREADIA